MDSIWWTSWLNQQHLSNISKTCWLTTGHYRLIRKCARTFPILLPSSILQIAGSRPQLSLLAG